MREYFSPLDPLKDLGIQRRREIKGRVFEGARPIDDIDPAIIAKVGGGILHTISIDAEERPRAIVFMGDREQSLAIPDSRS
jgi:hypothetical protein